MQETKAMQAIDNPTVATPDAVDDLERITIDNTVAALMGVMEEWLRDKCGVGVESARFWTLFIMGSIIKRNPEALLDLGARIYSLMCDTLSAPSLMWAT